MERLVSLVQFAQTECTVVNQIVGCNMIEGLPYGYHQDDTISKTTGCLGREVSPFFLFQEKFVCYQVNLTHINKENSYFLGLLEYPKRTENFLNYLLHSKKKLINKSFIFRLESSILTGRSCWVVFSHPFDSPLNSGSRNPLIIIHPSPTQETWQVLWRPP